MTTLLGAAAVTRMQRKNRGGDAGGRGQDFEGVFVAHRTARLFRKFFERGLDAQIEWQAKAFVDDVVVRRDYVNSFKGYQLKDSTQVSWTADGGAITTDFADQIRVCAAEGYDDTRLRLVCSDADRAQRLAATIPESIAANSGAFCFPHDKPLRMFAANPWMADDFAYLSRKPRATLGDCAEVLQVLLGAWAILKPVASVSGVYEQARRVSPQVLRPTRPDGDVQGQLEPAFRALLDAIPDFNYSVERGFLAWSSPTARTEGTLSFDCFSARFAVFQQSIVALGPTTFEEIEGLLV